MKYIFKNILKGMIIGTAEVIPGISGSTLALAMGIYDDLIIFINNLLLIVKKKLFYKINNSLFPIKRTFQNIKVAAELNLNFGLSILFGVIFINVILINLIPVVINKYPNYLQAIFFGIVLGSVNVPFKSIKNKNFTNLSITFLFTVLFSVLSSLKPSSIVIDPNPIYLFITAVFAVLAMLLPGVSGSFVLMLFGVYEYLLNLAKSLINFSVNVSQLINLLMFAAGAICALIFFVKYIKIGLIRYSDKTFSVLLGCILGSLSVLIPFFEPVYENDILVDKVFYFPLYKADSYDVFLVLIFIVSGFLFIKLIQKLTNSGT